jgi:hypothetical protein
MMEVLHDKNSTWAQFHTNYIIFRNVEIFQIKTKK